MKQLEFIAETVQNRSEHDRQQKAAQAAGHANDAGYSAHAVGKIVADIFEGRRHATGECDAEREQQER